MNKIDEKAAELSAVLQEELGEIEMKVLTGYTLADAIREGCKVSDQAYNWGDGDTACALSAAVIAATARGFMKE
jgi:hypothetical protein